MAKRFKRFQNKLTLSDIQYGKNYTVGKEYLEHVAEENNWEYIEIVEDTKEYKYGLLLIAYEDDKHEEEIDHICIDLANLDMFVPVCSQCGAFITDETWQNEYEETICEECLIQNRTKAFLHKFYIGSNDKDEHKQLTGNKDIQECIRSSCGLFFDSYTMSRSIGYFEGELENTYIIEVVSKNETVETTEFAALIKTLLNQACIMYTKQSIDMELL